MRVLLFAACATGCLAVLGNIVSADEPSTGAGRASRSPATASPSKSGQPVRFAAQPNQPVAIPTTQQEAEPLPPAEGAIPIPNSVMLRADGTLKGSLRTFDPASGQTVPVVDVSVVFIRNGRVVATATPSRQGDFLVSTLRPGIHSIVVHGPGGFMAIGVPIVGFDETALNNDEEARDGRIMPVSLVQNEPGQFTLNLLAPPSDVAAISSVIQNQQAGGPPGPPDLGGPPPFGPGAGFGPGGAPGGFGGGGGGPGGGGFGDLLGLGGLALGAAALSDDRGGNRGRGRGPIEASATRPVRRGPADRD